MNVAKRLCVAGFVLLMSAVSSVDAEAQWPPEKIVRIVVPFSAGGIGDVLMRLLAQELSDGANRTVVVENRPGGGSVIGTEAVAHSTPDGTSLLFVANSFLINAHVKARLPYDPLTSFAPICLLARTPMVLVVNSNSNHQSLAQLIQTAREPQSRLSFGGTGPNTTQHLAFEAFKAATSTDLRFVSFGGDPSAVSNVLGGHITAALVNYAAVKEQLGAALRPLAVGTRERLAELPDVPSFAELGFTQVEAAAWMGLVVPAKTPADTTALITDLVRSMLDRPQMKGKLNALGVLPIGLCARDFVTFLSREHERYGGIIKAANIKAE